MASTGNPGIPEILQSDPIPCGLVEADVIKLAGDVLSYLHSADSYDNQDTVKVMKGINQIYCKYRSLRKTFAEKLAENGFAEKAHAMLTNFKSEGVFKNDSVWFLTLYTLGNCWNYSDTSLEFAKKLVEAGFVTMMLSNISCQLYLDNQNSENVTYVLKSSLSILHNIAKVPGSPVVFREQNAPALLQPFTTSENEFFKAVAMMCITAIISEAENAVLEDTGTINFMVNSLSKAISKASLRRYEGFTPTELVECLGRMAVNDSNKIKVVEAGALPLFVKMMMYDDEEEQYAAAHTIWTLSFDKNVKEKIIKEPNCVSSLEKLSESENRKVNMTSKGALWMIKDSASQEKLEREKNITEAGAAKDHIFLSYQWDNQQIIVQLANRLKADGFRVWVDVEQMGGSTLEAMALAVENAAVVLIGMSEKYKISPNCRTEGEYTFKRQKALVPLMMQQGYKPDGWLGMLLGAKLYINFDGKYEFDRAYQMLLRELKDRGRGATDQSQAQSQTVPTESQPGQPQLATWKKDDVEKWLNKNDLQRLTGRFEEYDGEAMKQLYKMKCEAPEFFYNALDKKFEMNMLDILLFVGALDNLPK